MTERPADLRPAPAGPAWKRGFLRTIPIFLVLLFVVQCAWFIRTQSFVYDEPIHIAAGLQAWRDHSFGYFNDHPPLARMWFTLPIIFSRGSSRWQLDLGALVRSEPM